MRHTAVEAEGEDLLDSVRSALFTARKAALFSRLSRNLGSIFLASIIAKVADEENCGSPVVIKSKTQES